LWTLEIRRWRSVNATLRTSNLQTPISDLSSPSAPRYDPAPMTEDALALAEILWDYHHLHHDLAPADVILVLCSHDVVVAERGADLFLEGLAPLLIFSGGSGAITRQLWPEPEAEVFARVAIGRGVPGDAILIEPKSTNTGENVRYTRDLLTKRGLDPERFIVVQKPYMERRAYATFRRVWPEKHVRVTSPRVSFREYPARGFQVPQHIPDEVWAAYEALVRLGFDRHLIA